jgi:pimeloyl-ACP methyl ester carboxylesterase
MPLLERRLRLVYIEPIGTGLSGRLADPRGYTIERYARQIRGVLDHLELRRAHLLGHSHGGFVAQRFAIDHSERLSSLVLYATSPVAGAEFLADAVGNIERIAERSRDPQMREAFRAIWSSGDDATFTRLFREIFPAYFADYTERAKELEPLRAALVASWAPMLGESPQGPFDVRNELMAVRVPTLIASGVHDYICGPRWATLLASALPHAKALSFEKSGHMAHLEEPELFASAVAGFVGGS